MTATQTWSHIHLERRHMVETLAGLNDEQWAAASWCEGWTVRQAAGHILAAAEQTPLHFYRSLVGARFRFDTFTDRDARRLGALPTTEMVERLQARTTTTNRPPAPVIAMLGEIVVHGADIRRPLGIEHRPSDAALVAVADNYRRTNLLIGSKRRIAGLRMQASDADWATGSGPTVTGPLLSLIMAMSGRRPALADLAGDGLATLSAR